MTTNAHKPEQIAEEIARTESKLEELQHEIAEIGEPAAHDLRQRVEALKIGENALQRNFAEAQAGKKPDLERMKKVEALLHHIEVEEASVQHEADFLHLGAPSSVSLAVEGSVRLYDLGARGIKRILRDRRPWRSPFVNRTYKTLAAKFNLPEEDDR